LAAALSVKKLIQRRRAINRDTIYQKIKALKEKKNAVILAHNYQPEEIQAIADYTGDSLGLSRQAAGVEKDMIVFCGVFFMAETAKILSIDKKVMLPDLTAGCPMADMLTGKQLREFKAKYPGSIVVCYVNSTAEVKAESDVCCTSSNAIKVIESLPRDKIILFVPDMYLGNFVQMKTGREIICWKGYCPTHALVTREMVLVQKEKHPDAVVVVHPECRLEVIQEAHEALSTGQMISYIQKSSAKSFIIGTEKGMLYRLKKDNPEKQFYIVTKDLICPNMKKISLEKLLYSLEEEKEAITVAPDIADRARHAINRMMEIH
jgi:quinolinate synthase